jgi:hypothetical protein
MSPTGIRQHTSGADQGWEKPQLTGRLLFVLVLLSHDRRRIVHVNITHHPMAT